MVTRRKTSSAWNPRNYKTIPFDLVIEILLRFPAKSIARFRCVSKLWQSTLRDPHFTDSFLTMSSSRPKLLFTCVKDGEMFFLSSPHPQEDMSHISANNHMSFPVNCSFTIYRPVRGLVCGLHSRITKGTSVSVPLICNPSTGQSLVLPNVITRRKEVINFLGFDPIDRKFKVLCMTLSDREYFSGEHQVLTLETGKKPSRKMIKCDILHKPASVDYIIGYPRYNGICINGVLYYLAFFDRYPAIVCFEFRSNRFTYIKEAHGMKMMNSVRSLDSTLVNYKGKLAMLQPNTCYGTCYGIQLWVLEDAEKHEWSKYIYDLPDPWIDIFKETKFCFVGTTGKGAIVLSPKTASDVFYLLYFSPERNIIDKVVIKGVETFKGHRVCTFLDHVEDVKLVSSFLDHGLVT